MSSTLLLVLALFLVLLNGFFVAAEFSLVKLRTTRVRAMSKAAGWQGRILGKVHTHLDAYLSACQLGITLASLGLGWVGEPALARLLEPLFSLFGIVTPAVIHGISFFIAFFTLSYLHIVIGELAPKSMAIRMPERVGLWTAAPLYCFYWLMYPAIWFLNNSANFVLRQLRLDVSHAHDSHYSSDELKIILRSSRADSNFTHDEWRVLAQALDFRELELTDLMRPFTEAVPLLRSASLQENLERIVQHRYSRYPLLDDAGHVLGVIHLKDVFFAQHNQHLPNDLDEIARPVQTVSPTLPAMELFRRFREGAPHFAVVVDSDRIPLGFVTLDNLLGALVGEIRDEFRQSQNEWMKMDDGSLIGKGSLPIFTLERALGIDIDDDAGDTIAGLVLWKLAEIPNEGQKVEFDQFDVVVKRMDGPRIVMVRVYPRKSAEI